MKFVDDLFRLELFAYPAYLRAKKLVVSQNTDELERRAPKLAKQLQHFPQLKELLSNDVLELCGNSDGEENGLKMLGTLYTHFPSHQLGAMDWTMVLQRRLWNVVDQITSHEKVSSATRALMVCAVLEEFSLNNNTQVTARVMEKILADGPLPVHRTLDYLYDRSQAFTPSSSTQRFPKSMSICPLLPPTATAWEVIARYAPPHLLEQAMRLHPPQKPCHVAVLIHRTGEIPESLMVEMLKRKVGGYSLWRIWRRALEDNNIACKDNVHDFLATLEVANPTLAQAYKNANERLTCERQRARIAQAVVSPSFVAARRKM